MDTIGLASKKGIASSSAARHCVETLSDVDRRALTEMLVNKIIIARHPSKIDKDGRRHSSSAPSHTKNLNKRLSGSRRCRRPGSRSSPESERVREAARSRQPIVWVTGIRGTTRYLARRTGGLHCPLTASGLGR